MKKILGFALVLIIGFFLSGCDDSDPLVSIRVINETGRSISDVRLTGSDGTVLAVQADERRAMGNHGQGHCWVNRDETYTLSWYCEERGQMMYAQMGGYCGGRENAQPFSFRGGQQRSIVLRADDTWVFSS